MQERKGNKETQENIPFRHHTCRAAEGGKHSKPCKLRTTQPRPSNRHIKYISVMTSTWYSFITRFSCGNLSSRMQRQAHRQSLWATYGIAGSRAQSLNDSDLDWVKKKTAAHTRLVFLLSNNPICPCSASANAFSSLRLK